MLSTFDLTPFELMGCCVRFLTTRYFEEKGSFDKAVLLYQKGGKVARALDLCFKGKLFDSLRQIGERAPACLPACLLACHHR
jgi:hypothetical protein